MSKYVEISSQNYCVEEVKCLCEMCGEKFYDYIPSNYELVRVVAENGEKYFLPTYGKNGYLDLMQRLVENWNQSDTINRGIVKKFENKILDIIPCKVHISSEVFCPFCNSKKIDVMQRTLKNNHPLKWLKVDLEKLQCEK